MTEPACAPDSTPPQPVLHAVPDLDEQAEMVGNTWARRPDRDGLVTP